MTSSSKLLIKKDIREKVLKKRNSLQKEEILNLSSHICAHTLKEINFNQKILFYYPTKNEASLFPVIQQFWEEKREFYLPISSKDTLLIGTAQNKNELKKGKFGIFEPTTQASFPSSHLDIVLVPGLSFDIFGNRLGYGRGYYDKFLENLPCLKIGIAYDFQIVKQVPINEYDIPMDLIITNKGVIKCQ